MLIHEEATTRATPERAWELLSDPMLHALWNPRIVNTGLSGSPRLGVGLRYRVTYELSGRHSEFDAEVTEFEAPRLLTIRLEEREKGDGKHWNRYMVERYLVSPDGDRTHVRHEVRVFQSGVPLWARVAVWLILQFGKPTGPTFMEHFAELAEEEPASEPRRAA